jgi:phosphoribosyl 1,2-cyclic phosphodiesterase
MQVTFHGVRGSIATSGPRFAGVGGNTTCIEVRHGGERLILDGGTGLRGLGDQLLGEARAAGGRVKATLLFTHLHWDHIQGFPFFAPAFVPGTELTLLGPVEEGGAATLEDALAKQMTPPCFPVPLAAMAAEKRFGVVAPGEVLALGPFTVHVRRLHHPQGVLGYRIEAGGKAVCFATDTEVTPDQIDLELLELARGADLLIHDAQYTEAQYAGQDGPCRRGWGHSTYVTACRVAEVAGARRLALFHHDPGHDDARVAAIEADARTRFEAAFAAKEGLTIDV